MAMTPIGNAVSYLPVSEFLARADFRTVGDLCSDKEVDDNAGPARVPLANLPTNKNLLTAILGACGLFEAALMTGGRYTVADFKALKNGSPAQALMYDILSEVTKMRLFSRRPTMTDMDTVKRANGWLELLASGQQIFAFQETADAGVMQVDKETPATVANRNGLSSWTRFGMGRRMNERRSIT